MPTLRLAFPTDEHYPFQDDHARAVALKIVSDFDPHIRIAGSDGIDFYAVSAFDKNPDRIKKGGLQYEINCWMAGQREWRDAAPNARAFFLIGNHEDRLRRYLWRHPELFDLDVLRLPSLLRMAELDIVWEKEKGERANQELALYNRLTVRHGEQVRKYPAYSAKAELESEMFAISLLTGHTHRGGSYYARTRTGLVQAHECFCLCDLNPEYVRNPNWQQGIVLAEVSPNHLAVEAIPFHRRLGKVTAYWRGKEYTE